MASEVILCEGCGITLRPFMKVCPRCGAVREDATPISLPEAPAEPASDPLPEPPTQPPAADAPEQKTQVIPFDIVRLQQQPPSSRAPENEDAFAPPQNLVFLSPNETVRRFPLLTAAQKTLIGIGIGILVLMGVIAFLLWRQQKREEARQTNATVTIARPTPIAGPTVEPSPTPTPPTPVDDAALTQSVKAALMAYSPLGFSRFKFEVKEGIVTVNGDAEHQPEKDGVDNVLKMIPGVKSVVNNLQVRPEISSASLYNGSSAKLNTAEARILDEAMQRQIRLAEQAAGAAPTPAAPQNDAQREEERRRREQAAARLREEEAALRKAAEDKLRRENEEYDRRQEELRRAEADRRARADQARLDANTLRFGTVAWSGTVDGVDEIIIAGGSASVRHVSGAPARDVRTSFSAPIPRAAVNVKLLSANGRGPISIVQEPSAANGYTTIVRIDDSARGGEKLYQFTLRWSAP